jgi:hypothetical protein
MRAIRLPLAALLLLTACFATPLSTGARAQSDDPLDVVTVVTYDVRPDQGHIRVKLDVTITNNDPATSPDGDANNGVIAFYNRFTVPVLKGAEGVVALTPEGTALDVETDESSRGPVMTATVTFDRRLFFGQTYRFALGYELSEVREPSLLVTPFYVYLPVIASGGEATVKINTPGDPAWSVALDAADCTGEGRELRCSGADAGATYLAAFVEVSRPDAVSTILFQLELAGRPVTVTVRFFQGEDEFGRRLEALTRAALPVIEELYGFAYPGPSVINLAQGGRQMVLGYEGLTTCDLAECRIVVSPVAEDVTILHELAHLWSGIYAKRWLSEGFAQLIAEEAAARLPQELIRSGSPVRRGSPVDLQLDDWGQVTSVIGASEHELAVEDAGYDRSLRFLSLLRFEVGLAKLQEVNAAIVAGRRPADSRLFMDLLEEAAGRSLDELFRIWVFPESVYPALEQRREARSRLDDLLRSAAETAVPDDVVLRIRDLIGQWRFGEALALLDEAENGVSAYTELQARTADLRSRAAAVGLTVPPSIAQSLEEWDFATVRRLLAEANEALRVYSAAQTRIAAPRGLWQRFGLLGSNPDGELREAAAAFERGDFRGAIERAGRALEALDNASAVALRRLLIVAGIMAAFALAIGVAVWISHLRERGFAER